MYTSSQVWQLMTHEASAACRKSSSYATPSSTTPCLKTSRLFESKEDHKYPPTSHQIFRIIINIKATGFFWHMMWLCRVMIQMTVSSDMCTRLHEQLETLVDASKRLSASQLTIFGGNSSDSYPFWLDIFCIFSNLRLHFYHPCRLPIKASKII